MFRGQKGDQYTGSPETGSAPDKRTGKSKKEAGSLPVLPPKIDRQKKPSKKSAAERLFGRSSGDRSSGGAGAGEEPGADAAETEDTAPETRVTGGFHSMPPSVAENNKKNTYDSNSSSFDSYNKHAAEAGYNGYSRSETEKSPAENNASDNAEKSDSEEETDTEKSPAEAESKMIPNTSEDTLPVPNNKKGLAIMKMPRLYQDISKSLIVLLVSCTLYQCS